MREPTIMIERLSSALVTEAKRNLPPAYQSGLANHSLVARWLVAKQARVRWADEAFIPEFATGGSPACSDSQYWSISHKEDWVAVALYEQPIGIDLEPCVARDTALLSAVSADAYTVLGEKNWHNFYVLWTAREALLKRLRVLTLDDVSAMQPVQWQHDTLTLEYFQQRFDVRVELTAEYTCSYTYA